MCLPNVKDYAPQYVIQIQRRAKNPALRVQKFSFLVYVWFFSLFKKKTRFIGERKNFVI